MTNPLRVGVIGVGRGWRRFRRALSALADRFVVQALCDQVREQAAQEAEEVGCADVAGPAALLEDAEVEALLLVDTQWYGWWPVERACRLGKPVLCAVPLAVDDAHADALHQLALDSRVPVLIEMRPRLAPATERLRALLESELGPARFVVCESVQPPARVSTVPDRRAPAALLGPRGIALVDWCLSLLGGEPVAVQASGLDTQELASLFLELADGRAVQVFRRRAPGARRSLRLEVIAERGSATVELPGQVLWTDQAGRHAHLLPKQRPVCQTLLERFFQVVREGQAPAPDLATAYQALRWLRAAGVSWAEGKRIAVSG